MISYSEICKHILNVNKELQKCTESDSQVSLSDLSGESVDTICKYIFEDIHMYLFFWFKSVGLWVFRIKTVLEILENMGNGEKRRKLS